MSAYVDCPRLLPWCDRSEFLDACYLNDWWLVALHGRDGRRDRPLSLTFSTEGHPAQLHWVEDYLVAFPYIVVSGDRADECARSVAPLFRAMTDDEILDLWAAEREPERKAVVALYLGVAAPPEPEPRFQAAIAEALGHGDAAVRGHALTAISYRTWPTWGAALKKVRRSDPDEDNREFARILLTDGRGRC